jgi:transposase
MRIAFASVWPTKASSPVIPPISTRSKKLPYDQEHYRGRNRVARFFNKLKQFRRIATC